MKKTYILLASVIAFSTYTSLAMINQNNIKIESTTVSGQPNFITGNLGKVISNNLIITTKEILARQPKYHYSGNENFIITKQWVDELGKGHAKLSQTINALPVYGTSLIIHADTNKTGEFTEITAISGVLATTDRQELTLQKTLMKDGSPSIKASNIDILAKANALGNIASTPELAYIYLPESGKTKLAWKIAVQSNKKTDGLFDDDIFFDAKTGDILTRHPKIQSTQMMPTLMG